MLLRKHVFVSIWDTVSIFINRFLDVSEVVRVYLCLCGCVTSCVSGFLGLSRCVSLIVCVYVFMGFSVWVLVYL